MRKRVVGMGASLFGAAVLAGASACASDLAAAEQGLEEEPVLSEAKLIIEHNATDEDTGFQAFVDGEPWKQLGLVGPGGSSVLSIKAHGSLRTLGLTELFFETQEPANDELPIAELLALMPAGQYQFRARSIEGIEMLANATLTHDIPAGPNILVPDEGAIVDPSDLVVSWEPVATSLTGASIQLVAYQLIVEKDAEPHPHAFASRVMSVHVSPSVTSVTVPEEFLEPASPYKLEVLAIEASGNQTIASSSFETE